MKSRFYSIASDSIDTNKLEICFKVESYQQEDIFQKGHTITKQGVCSSYLHRLSEEDKVEFEVKICKKSLFNITKKELKYQPPLIFICQGTAVVPLIGVLRRIKRMLDTKEIKGLGNIDFYYGIKNQAHDYLYKEEIEVLFEHFASTNPYASFKTHISESMPSDPADKKYVDDIINQDNEDLEYKILVKKGTVYFCCDENKTAKAVETILEEIVGSSKQLGKIFKDGRYKKEVWTRA
uniref:NADPH--hemoprotein reductase n=1 Tax=Euplotes crassus TaxID=5936 RepID=A0A7S3NTM0_EUPCR|mmetsp:Transcript_159/g.155  ORF Transcript_159/g.155 Transcript_159/m.155 type:complete len:237 (+) Transcript_159:343-1053(+)|eukprot:CAMPEP_0197001440 /NCGR_PEP_ID=MMETSP1380-20130617/6137_1 /TAXON_ID=5936 /ORGANISM="Euplotes crassus, Strain CT5" /LENGTH=236 /DNA_ID=CAMNT_0042419113 /DNA_START=327 /DNA_END=1037 /DNA_ORIENTATION=+